MRGLGADFVVFASSLNSEVDFCSILESVLGVISIPKPVKFGLDFLYVFGMLFFTSGGIFTSGRRYFYLRRVHGGN